MNIYFENQLRAASAEQNERARRAQPRSFEHSAQLEPLRARVASALVRAGFRLDRPAAETALRGAAAVGN